MGIPKKEIANNNSIARVTKSDFRSSAIKISNFPLPDYSSINSISFISSKEIYVFSQNSIFLFDGKKFNFIYKLKNQDIIRTGSCNGKYLAFSSFNSAKDYFTPNLTIIQLSKNPKNPVAKIFRCKVPFSNYIGSIQFINHNMMYLTGFLEYGYLIISDNNSLLNFSKEFHHFPLTSPSASSTITSGICLDKNINIYVSRYSAYFLNTKSSLAKINLLFDLSSIRKNGSKYVSIGNLIIADTNFGAFSTNSFYFFNNSNSKVNLYKVESLKLNNGGIVSQNNILAIIPFSKTNIWAITKNGEILHQIVSNNSWDIRQWLKVSDIQSVATNNLFAVDSNYIYLLGPTLMKLKILYNSKANTKYLEGNRNETIFQASYIQDNNSTYGSGTADFNNDGKLDIYLVNVFGQNELYLNINSPNAFSVGEESASERGVTGRQSIAVANMVDLNSELGLAIGDITENGNEDIYITRLAGNNFLFQNNGKGYFKNVTKNFSLDKDIGRSECAVLSDVFNNGYLDIFTTSFLNSNVLFKNEKGVKFNDWTKKSNLISKGASVCAAFADINNDGYPDLYVGNWMRENKLYLNNGDGTFKDITEQSGTGCGNLKMTNSVLFADFNNDGKLDLFVGNRGSGNKFFLNEGNGKFKDISNQVGLGDSLYTYGATFGDFNNDGYLDLFVSYLGGFKVYENMMGNDGGKLFFKDVTKSYLGENITYDAYNTSAITLDYDNDGNLDVFAAQSAGRSILFKNKLNEHSLNKNIDFLEVTLVGSQSNRDAVGAKLKLFRNDTLIAYREVFSGYGYASSSSKIQHFGLGDGKGNFKLQVIFPASGIIKTLSVFPNKFITIHEHEGITEEYFIAKKYLLRYIFGKEVLYTALRLIILLIIIISIPKIKPFRLPLSGVDKKNYFILLITVFHTSH